MGIAGCGLQHVSEIGIRRLCGLVCEQRSRNLKLEHSAESDAKA